MYTKSLVGEERKMPQEGERRNAEPDRSSKQNLDGTVCRNLIIEELNRFVSYSHWTRHNCESLETMFSLFPKTHGTCFSTLVKSSI